MLRMYTSLTGIMSYLRVRACVYVCVCLMLSACQHLYPPTPPSISKYPLDVIKPRPDTAAGNL